MKLVISKSDANEINIKIKNGEEEKEFSYVDMITLLCDQNTIEAIEYGERIEEQEKNKLNIMITKINEKVTGNDVK